MCPLTTVIVENTLLLISFPENEEKEQTKIT